MAFVSRRLVGVTISAFSMAAAMGTAGCTGVDDNTPHVSPSPSPSSHFDPTSVAAAAEDLWISGDKAGYYLGQPDPNATPFSLADTYWNVRLREYAPTRGNRLNPVRIKPWLLKDITGQRTESLPRAVQVEYAVGTARALNISVDPNVVTSALEPMRINGLYRSSSNDEQGDWGSTAHAVSALRQVGAPVDASVREKVRTALATASTETTAVQVVEDLAPQMLIAALLKDQISRPVPQETYNRAISILDDAGADPATVATRAILDTAAKSLGLTVATDKRIMCRILDSDGSVRLPDDDTPNLQLTYYASSLGCHVRIPPEAPYSRAGWPDNGGKPLTTMIQNAVAPTAEMLRLYRRNGTALPATVHAKLINTLHNSWIPGIKDSTFVTLAQATRLARVAEISRYLGQPVPSEISSNDIPGDAGAGLMRMVAFAQVPRLNRQQIEACRKLIDRTSKFERQNPLRVAAALEIASRLLHDAQLHANATRIISPRRQAAGIYSVRPGAGAPASLQASLVGAWVSNDSEVPMQAWVRAGMCNTDLVCRESRQDSLDNAMPTLRGTLIALECQRPHCGTEMPSFF
ncbi:hypothetical protein KRMM14A1004_44080 [Krasilnikovia sp. MM14-A1004]